jgi:hypothetical protein
LILKSYDGFAGARNARGFLLASDPVDGRRTAVKKKRQPDQLPMFRAEMQDD